MDESSGDDTVAGVRAREPPLRVAISHQSSQDKHQSSQDKRR
jgi:hypothetical protein